MRRLLLLLSWPVYLCPCVAAEDQLLVPCVLVPSLLSLQQQLLISVSA